MRLVLTSISAAFCSARTTIAVATLFVVGLQCACRAHAESPTVGGLQPKAVAEVQEPALLKAVMAARWRLASVRAGLPSVQLVRNEALEIQDFTQYAFDGGALRLYVSPGRNGGDIFALLVDTRDRRYADFAQLASTRRYATYHQGAYVVVVPLRLVSQALFGKLKARRWTEEELQRHLGAASYHWHIHGIGYLGLTYVPQGLSFIADWPGPRSRVRYQMRAPDDFSLPPLASLSALDYREIEGNCRETFAKELIGQREEIDRSVASGKRSPDGRFVVGHVNLGGLANTEEVVICETGKPERRYSAPHFTYDNDYLWLNARTIVFKVYAVDQTFYTIDALTGVMQLAADVPSEDPFEERPRIVDFGVSGPQQFWYKTEDGKTHEVTVRSHKPRTHQ